MENGPVSTARDRPPEEAAEDSSFARGLRLLLTISDRGEIRADELATLLEMPASTVYRYLRTLAGFGFVDRHDGIYRLGPRLLIGSSGSNISSELLTRLSDPVLHMLVDETGETAVVMRRVGLSAVCLHQVESTKGMRVVLDPGVPSPLYAGAMARVLLAFAPAEILDEVIADGIDPLTPTTPDESTLREGLEEIRATEVAVSEGELVRGSVAMSVPVLREDGIVGSLAVLGPDTRCGIEWRARVRRLLPDAAQTLMTSLTQPT